MVGMGRGGAGRGARARTRGGSSGSAFAPLPRRQTGGPLGPPPGSPPAKAAAAVVAAADLGSDGGATSHGGTTSGAAAAAANDDASDFFGDEFDNDDEDEEGGESESLGAADKDKAADLRDLASIVVDIIFILVKTDTAGEPQRGGVGDEAPRVRAKPCRVHLPTPAQQHPRNAQETRRHRGGDRAAARHVGGRQRGRARVPARPLCRHC